MVYIEGEDVIAEDNIGRSIASGDAGLDDADIIRAALSHSNSVVRLSPNTTYSLNKRIPIIGSQRLVGGGLDSTVLNYTGIDDEVILVNGTSSFVIGASVSDIKINANNKTALHLKATAPSGITRCQFERIQIFDPSIGIQIEPTGNANEIYKCSFKDMVIENPGLNGILASAGCYNSFRDFEICGVKDTAYAIYTIQWGASFNDISCDGVIWIAGANSNWNNITIESIFAAMPISDQAFRVAGAFHTITGLELISVDPMKCPYGVTIYGPEVTINGLRALGSSYPTYLYNPPMDFHTIAININHNSGTWAHLDSGKMKNVTCVGGVLQTQGSDHIDAGSTYVDVAHGLATSPTKYGIKTWKEPIGDRNWWVDNIRETAFRVNLSTSDMVEHAFVWEASV